MSTLFTLSRRVLFGDCDPAGIVYTPRFSSFALEATHDALDHVYGEPWIAGMKRIGILTPVRALEMEFMSQVSWEDVMELRVEIAAIRVHSFTLRVSGFLSGDVTAFISTITYVTISDNSRTKIPLPAAFLACLNRYSLGH